MRWVVLLVVLLLSGCVAPVDAPAWHASVSGFCYNGSFSWEQPALLESLDGAAWPVTEERRDPGLPLSDPDLRQRWGAPHLVSVRWTDPGLEGRVVHDIVGWPSLGFVDDEVYLRAVFHEHVSPERAKTDMAALLGQVLGWPSARSGEVLRDLEPNEGQHSVNGVPVRPYFHVFEVEGSADAFVQRLLLQSEATPGGWDGFGRRVLETEDWTVEVSVPVLHLEARHGGGVSVLRLGPDGHVEYVHGADRALPGDEVRRLALDAVARNGWPRPTWETDRGVHSGIDAGCAGAGS